MNVEKNSICRFMNAPHSSLVETQLLLTASVNNRPATYEIAVNNDKFDKF